VSRPDVVTPPPGLLLRKPGKNCGRETGKKAPMPRVNGTFDEFLAKLLVRESGIDPALFPWYVREFDSPVLAYPAVTTPGRGVRDAQTGRFTFRPITVAQYFEALGVRDFFDPRDADCIEVMQHASTNALGFIGYQFGESILIDAGYYRPERVRISNRHGRIKTVESYYIGAIDEGVWRGGRTEMLYQLPGTRSLVLASDVNRWRGTFTGKNGVRTTVDLKDPVKQRRVMRDVADLNYRRIKAIFKRTNYTLRSEETWSSLIAAAHLSGCEAAARFALSGTNVMDQFGTSIQTYFEAFAGFQTPYM
jgi:hypothetical protein